MSGDNKILADTNLIILAMGGNQKARQFLEGNTLLISIITEIELLSISFSSPQDEKLMIDFISHCYVIGLDNEVKRQTISLRKKLKIKLPYAIIAAVSLSKKLALFTANKGFSKIRELDFVLF